jgi:hypothetical protein
MTNRKATNILVATYTVLAAFLLVVIATLAGCGGGIDTPDEQMGPPPSAINEPQPPRPCPIDPAACHPKPFPG